MAMTPGALGVNLQHAESRTCDKDNGLQVFQMEQIINPPSGLATFDSFHNDLLDGPSIGWYRLRAHSDDNYCLSVMDTSSCGKLLWWEACGDADKKQMWHFQKFQNFYGIVREILFPSFFPFASLLLFFF